MENFKSYPSKDTSDILMFDENDNLLLTIPLDEAVNVAKDLLNAYNHKAQKLGLHRFEVSEVVLTAKDLENIEK